MGISDDNKKLRENDVLLYCNVKIDKPGTGYYLNYHEKNKKFIDFLFNFYNLENKKILDYGCGSGFITDLFSKKSDFVSGCDISEAQLEIARELTSSQIHYFEDDFFNSKLQKSQYDFIFCRGLSVLVKMNLDDDAVSYIKSIIDSLNDDGVAYFVFYGNLTGIKDNVIIHDFRNPTINQLFSTFNKSGFVSMINFYGYQAIIVTRNKNLAEYYNKKMERSVIKLLNNLIKKDIGEYIACQFWLLANSTRKNIEKFKKIDQFIDDCFLELIAVGICKKTQNNHFSDDYDGDIFFIDGDHDSYYKQFYEQEYFKNNIFRRKLRKIKRHFFK